MVTMRATFASVRDAVLLSLSPTRIVPDAIGAGIAAERLIRPVDILHREAERSGHSRATAARRFPATPAALSPRVPRHAGAAAGDVVAVAGADRNRGDRQVSQLVAQQVEAGHDAVEHRLIEPDQIHLVDREHHRPNAQQRGDGGMPPGLVEQPVTRIDQQNRQIGGRCAGRHVARVLLMTRRIRQDEAAPRRFEEPVGDVDRHALFAFRLQPIDQQRVIDAAFHRAETRRVALQRRSSHRRGSCRTRTATVRSRSICRRRRCRRSGHAEGNPASEIPLALLPFHRGTLFLIDQPAGALRHFRGAHFG